MQSLKFPISYLSPQQLLEPDVVGQVVEVPQCQKGIAAHAIAVNHKE